MKHSNLSKILGSGVLALSLAVLPSTLPASAQTSTSPTTTTTSPTTTTTDPNTSTTTTTYRTEGDRDFDWGWLGLLGLAGLAGLRRREEPTRYRDPNAVGTTGYREP